VTLNADFFGFTPRHSDKENVGKNEQRNLLLPFFHANTGDLLNVKPTHCHGELFTFFLN